MGSVCPQPPQRDEKKLNVLHIRSTVVHKRAQTIDIGFNSNESIGAKMGSACPQLPREMKKN